MRQLEQPVAQPVGAVRRVEADEAALDQRLEDAVQRPLGQAGQPGEVPEAQRPLALAHGIQHGQALEQGLRPRDGADRLLRARQRCLPAPCAQAAAAVPCAGAAAAARGRAPSTVVRSMTRRWPG